MNFVLILLVGSNSQTTTTQSLISCIRRFDIDNNQTLIFDCPVGSTMETFDIDNLTMIDTIEKLQVFGTYVRGPLKFIPKNICNFTKLKVNITR
jgi:hypothetical protein